MYILSVSHKFAPIEIRQQFALTESQKVQFLNEVTKNEHISECVYLSTCNRSEVYFNGDEKAIEEMEQFLIEFINLNFEVKKFINIYQDEKAIVHLYKVASGLDSMLIGEDEILGQLKDAFNVAHLQGATKYHLNTLFRGAITCAKNIKTNTKMSKIPVSLGTLVSNMISQKQGKVNVLIIGLTGKMGNTIFKNLYNNEHINIIGTTRNHNSVYEYNNKYSKVKMISYSERFDFIDEIDFVVSVTTSPHYTLTYQDVLTNIKEKKERVFIDLSVPKDIDTNIEQIENVKLFNVDYFKNIANENNNSKEEEVIIANSIILEYIDKVLKEIYFHEFLPNIDEIENIFTSNNFKDIMYKVRDEATSQELLDFINVLNKLKK